jgi:hypothetical protein
MWSWFLNKRAYLLNGASSLRMNKHDYRISCNFIDDDTGYNTEELMPYQEIRWQYSLK